MAVFINENGAYKKLASNIASKSINEISIHLGYKIDMVHSYHNWELKKNPISILLLEVFTENIIAVFADSDSLSLNIIEELLACFQYDFEYNSYDVQDILLTGIENKSFELDFLSRVLNFEATDKNGEYFSEKIETRLFFIDGYLASFKFGDDLNKWARHIKSINPKIISDYAIEAKNYWGDDYEKIFNEINLQSNAYAETPKAYKNKYVKKHLTEFGNVDFIMLVVCHYDQQISLKDFKLINHGRYNYYGKEKRKEVYSKGKFIYKFNNVGNLVKVEEMR